MTNLSRRILKAKEAEYIRIPGTRKVAFATFGSSQTFEYRYQIFLSSRFEAVNDPTSATEKINIPILIAECYQNSGIGTTCNCPGNEHNTVCYHALGSIFIAYKTLSNEYISYYKDYEDATNGLNFGGKLAKVESAQGDGVVWAVIRDIKPKMINNLPTNLMRGNENEGID